jgi:hypothetical protein
MGVLEVGSVVQYGGEGVCDECGHPHRFSDLRSGWARGYGAEL